MLVPTRSKLGRTLVVTSCVFFCLRKKEKRSKAVDATGDSNDEPEQRSLRKKFGCRVSRVSIRIGTIEYNNRASADSPCCVL